MRKPTKKDIAIFIGLIVAIGVIIWQVFFVDKVPKNVLSVDLLNEDIMVTTTAGVDEIILTNRTDNGTFCVCRANDDSIMIFYLIQDDKGNYNVKARSSVGLDNLQTDPQQVEEDHYPIENITTYYSIFLNDTEIDKTQHNGKSFPISNFNYQSDGKTYSIGFWCYDVKS